MGDGADDATRLAHMEPGAWDNFTVLEGAMSDGKKKAAWHSEIVGRSPVVLTFTAGPRKSNFGDKPDYARFTDTDGMDRTLNIENAQVRAVLESIPLNVPVVVTAAGSRDAASLKWESANGAVGGVSHPAPRATSNSAPKGAYNAPQMPTAVDPADAFFAALDMAKRATDLYRQRYNEEPSEGVRQLATTIYIGRQGNVTLPVAAQTTIAPDGDWLSLGDMLEEAKGLGCVNQKECERVEQAIASNDGERVKSAMHWLGTKIDAATKEAEKAKDDDLPF